MPSSGVGRGDAGGYCCVNLYPSLGVTSGSLLSMWGTIMSSRGGGLIGPSPVSARPRCLAQDLLLLMSPLF